MNDSEAQKLLEDGVERYRRRDVEGAIDVLRRALDLAPENERVCYHLGLAYADKGAYREALAYYDRAVALDPRDAYARNRLGCVLASLGQTREAFECYRAAVALNPRYPWPFYNLGLLLKSRGLTAEAAAEFARFAALRRSVY